MKRLLEPLARRIWPEAFQNTKSVLALNARVNALRDEREQWRKRAFSAEEAMRQVADGWKAAAEKHDKDHSTLLLFHW